jgi:hypothetical protein
MMAEQSKQEATRIIICQECGEHRPGIKGQRLCIPCVNNLTYKLLVTIGATK